MFLKLFILTLVIIQNVGAMSPVPCVWAKKSNTNTIGGTPMPYFTLQDCQNQCVNSATNCQYGIDWDQNNMRQSCWFSNTNVQNTALGVEHYYVTCPLSSTIAWLPGMTSSPPNTLPAMCSWNIYPNTNTKGGTPVPLLNDTLENCQMYCLSNMARCAKGIDYNPGNPIGQRCYLSVDTNWYFTVGISHYEMTSACFGAPMTTPSGTSGPLSVNVVTAVLALLLVTWITGLFDL